MSEAVGHETERDALALNALLARMPAVERVIASAQAQPLIATYGRTQVLATIRATLDRWRRDAQAGRLDAVVGDDDPFSLGRVIDGATHELAERAQNRLRPVFNLTGTVLHTNLGRALLPDESVRAVVQALTQPANLEFDLATGKRGDRDDLIDGKLGGPLLVGELLRELQRQLAAKADAARLLGRTLVNRVQQAPFALEPRKSRILDLRHLVLPVVESLK